MSKSSSVMPSLPFRKNPRPGQASVFQRLDRTKLNIQLPTGYGKTFTAFGCFALLQQAQRVSNLLYIVPTVPQLDQLYDNREQNLLDAGVVGSNNICRLREHGLPTVLKMMTGKNPTQIVATTIQFLSNARGFDNIRRLMETGKWMIVVDEYHHYGTDKAWSETLQALPSNFLLAMSATPYRKEKDSSYLGAPEVVVSYREAIEEKAVKPVFGHSYMYRIDLVSDEGFAFSMTTQELTDEFGNNPQKIQTAVIERKMRFTAKYVSPLVEIPLTRMISNRPKTGYRLQAIIGTMSVGHAEIVCTQVRSMFPELEVDWVGTKAKYPDGREYGRDAEVNKKILKRFAPPNKERPTLDVLVHVGMAGEGLDTNYISEVIHLNNASYTPQNIQENGRGSRYLEGVVCNINFDSSSEFAKRRFLGKAMADAMDGAMEYGEPGEAPPKGEDIYDLPDEPKIFIENLELIGIDSGDHRVQLAARAMKESGVTLSGDLWLDEARTKINPKGVDCETLIQLVKEQSRREAEAHNDLGVVAQLEEDVKAALTTITGLVKSKQMANGARFERSMLGDIKKRINTQKKRQLGAVCKDAEVLKTHYYWLRDLGRNIHANGLPSWLA